MSLSPSDNDSHLLNKLQSLLQDPILNAVALSTFYFVASSRCRTLVTGARREHITPVLRQLHWLPVRQRVVFKIAGLVHQSLGGAAPAYLADDCRLLWDVGRRPLRFNSNDTQKLLMPRTHNELSDRSFSDYGGRDCPLISSDNLWKLIYLATEALSDSIEFIGAI